MHLIHVRDWGLSDAMMGCDDEVVACWFGR